MSQPTAPAPSPTPPTAADARSFGDRHRTLRRLARRGRWGRRCQEHAGQTHDARHDVHEEGSALIWVMLLMPVLLGLLGLIFDGGAAINGSQEADNVADQAARAGADQLDTTSARADQGLYGPADAARAASTACGYVAVASPQMTCTASVNADAVVVAVSGTVPAQFFGIIGINELTVHGNGSADSHTGIDEEAK